MATRAWRIPQLIRNIYTTRVSAVGKNITVSPPLPDKLHDLIYAFRESKVLFAACDLGIFDILQDSDAPQSVADMSSKIGSNHFHPPLEDYLHGHIGCSGIAGKD